MHSYCMSMHAEFLSIYVYIYIYVTFLKSVRATQWEKHMLHKPLAPLWFSFLPQDLFIPLCFTVVWLIICNVTYNHCMEDLERHHVLNHWAFKATATCISHFHTLFQPNFDEFHCYLYCGKHIVGNSFSLPFQAWFWVAVCLEDILMWILNQTWLTYKSALS